MTTTDAALDAGVQFDTPLVIGGRAFRSRLMVGTGKYRSNAEMVAAIDAAGADVVTVAVRRVDLDRTKEEGVLFHLAPTRYFLLANTAGCYSADEAIRYARLGREAGFNDFVKLEVIGDRETLLPDAAGLLEATRVLVKEGFRVLAYTNDDLITALRLEDAGAAAVMPLASPIGSGLGLLNPYSIRTIKRRLSVPVIVDAGVGTAIRCMPDDGTGRGRHPDEHGTRGGARRGTDGACDARGGRVGPRGVPRGTDAATRGGDPVVARARKC
jgi:thiazole synthase